MRQHYLQELFAPESVAVFGANDDETSVGGRVLRNLRDAAYSGGLYPVNPHHETVQGLTCHARIGDAGVPVDLAIVATPAGVQIVDARIVVEGPQASREPYGHMAIHPFPSHMQRLFVAPDGTEITIRPIRPEDAGIEQAFVRELSDASRYLRFMASLKELSRETLVRFTQIDYDREMALIAITERGGRTVQLGVARYTITPDGEGCEFAIVVADEVQGTGLGSHLLGVLMEAARDRGLREMIGETMSTNDPMRTLAERMGFRVRTSRDDPTILLMHRRL